MDFHACPICGGFLAAFGPFSGRLYHECPACRWIVLDNRHHLPLEKQRERYLRHENTSENLGYVDLFEKFIGLGIAPYADKGKSLLDFGCGPEPVLAGLLRKKGYRVDVFDPFFHPQEPDPAKTYQSILLTEVLEHLPDPLAVLRPLLGRLEPGGTISLTTLFHPGDPRAFDQWWYIRDPTHISFYALSTIEKITEALGMTLVFTDSIKTAVLRRN